MTREVSLSGRCVGAATAVALLTASLAAPAAAMPLTNAGIGALDASVVQVQWPNKPGFGGKPGPAKPGWKPGPGPGPHPGGPGGHWAHHGGGHWHNGVWVPALAFGVLGAAAAAAMFGAPPQPGMCWYYDDPSQTTGHWDYC
jgi:hypothetical protein